MMCALGAAVLSGCAPGAAAGSPRPVAVRIVVAPLVREDVLHADRLEVGLKAVRRARVRAVVTFVSDKTSIRLYSRRVVIAAGRTRRLRLALPAAARQALESCATARLEVSVKARGRARRAAQPIPSAPPRCGRFFAPLSVWNGELAPGAELDPASDRIVGALAKEVSREFASGPQPTVNTTAYSVPIYTVPSDQPLVPVQLEGNDPALAQSFQRVPLPASARPAPGTDGHLVIWQPSRDKLWEFWRARHTSTGWRAVWGGSIGDVSASPGFYSGNQAAWGATASSFSIAGGLITAAELRRGEIPHALGIGVPHPRANVYAWPAQRTDGDSTADTSLPEGARLRLDPALDLDKLGLPPPVLAIARAAQRYGIIVRDHGEVVAFNAEDPTPLGANPYPQLFQGARPADLLRTFPWDHLQLLKMDLRGNGSSSPAQNPLPCGLQRCR